jgi:large subunit ribosomal protein L15
MLINELKLKDKKKRKKRVGRGGKRGTYSGRGQKGQKARAGHRIKPAEKYLIYKLPKLRGIKNKPKSEKPIIFNLSDLEKKWKDFIQVYPNPFQNQFTLEVPQSMNLYISNVLGQTLYSQPIEKGKNVIDLEAFPSGVYFIELQWKEEQWNTKLIKN